MICILFLKLQQANMYLVTSKKREVNLSIILNYFFATGGAGPIMGDLWALKGITEEGISLYLFVNLFG